MGCKVIFAPQAISDLAEAVRRIARDDPATAQRIGNALIDRVAILENFPLLGSSCSGRPCVRKLVSQPYIIYYRARPDEALVEILRYWHGARGDVPELESGG